MNWRHGETRHVRDSRSPDDSDRQPDQDPCGGHHRRRAVILRLLPDRLRARIPDRSVETTFGQSATVLMSSGIGAIVGAYLRAAIDSFDAAPLHALARCRLTARLGPALASHRVAAHAHAQPRAVVRRRGRGPRGRSIDADLASRQNLVSRRSNRRRFIFPRERARVFRPLSSLRSED